MKDFLKHTWDRQILQDFPLSVPFYNGVSFKDEDFQKDRIFSGMALYKNNMHSHVEHTIRHYAKLYKVNGNKMEILDIEFIDVDTGLDSMVKVVVTYDIVTPNGEKLDHHKVPLLYFPRVQDNYTIKLSGSSYSITDELVNDYNVYFKDEGPSRSLSLRLKDRGCSLTLTKYYEGTGVVVLRHYRTIHKAIKIGDVTDEDLIEQYDLTPIFHRLEPFIPGISESTSSLEFLNKVFEKLSDKTVFVKDDIRSKKIISCYDAAKKVLTETIKDLFINTSKYRSYKLRKALYKSVRTKFHKLPNMPFVGEINPINFLSSLRKLDLMGPNGPKKSNIEMRGYQNSYAGYIDPLETPESGQLGLTVHRAIACYYGEDGKLMTDPNMSYESRMLNYSASLIPFIQNTDSIRDSMASSHIKQTVPIRDPEVPLVSTGMDRIMYNLMNTPVTTSEGKFISEISDKYYFDTVTGEKLINSPGVRLTNDRTLSHFSPRFDVDRVYPEGYHLFNNSFFTDGYLSLGRNVLIAYMPFKAWNYEDAVALSKSLADKLVSMKGIKLKYTKTNKIVESEVIPQVGDYVEAGDVILTYRKKDKTTNLVAMYGKEVETIKVEKSGVVQDILLLDEKDKVVTEGWTTVHITISVEHHVEPGDKLSFTSAAKCTVAKIIPDDEMPRTHDGKVIDIIYNTIGIPSRMNLSQLFEVSLGYFNKLMSKEVFGKITTKSELLDAFHKIHGIIPTDTLGFFIEYLNDLSDESIQKVLVSLRNGFVIETKQFDRSVSMKQINDLFIVMGFDKTYSPDVGRELYLPLLQKNTRFPVFYGYSRILVLKHIVDEKNTSVSLPGLSDTGEKTQKVGEMEMLALEAHGSKHMINETTLIRSNSSVKNKLFQDIIKSKNPLGLVDLNRYKDENNAYKEFKALNRAMGIRIVDKVT